MIDTTLLSLVRRKLITAAETIPCSTGTLAQNGRRYFSIANDMLSDTAPAGFEVELTEEGGPADRIAAGWFGATLTPITTTCCGRTLWKLSTPFPGSRKEKWEYGRLVPFIRRLPRRSFRGLEFRPAGDVAGKARCPDSAGAGEFSAADCRSEETS